MINTRSIGRKIKRASHSYGRFFLTDLKYKRTHIKISIIDTNEYLEAPKNRHDIKIRGSNPILDTPLQFIQSQIVCME